MLSPSEQKRLTGQLASAFWHSGREQLSKEIEACDTRDKLEKLVRVLSRIERIKGLPTGLWELAVRGKGVIAGKVTLEKFIEESLKYQGLL